MEMEDALWVWRSVPVLCKLKRGICGETNSHGDLKGQGETDNREVERQPGLLRCGIGFEWQREQVGVESYIGGWHSSKIHFF